MKLGELKSAIRKTGGPAGVRLHIPGRGAFPFPLVKGAMIDALDAAFGPSKATETHLALVGDLLVMEGMEAIAFVPDPDTAEDARAEAPPPGAIARGIDAGLDGEDLLDDLEELLG